LITCFPCYSSCCRFSFSSYGALRVLHSFPTRRSSDLVYGFVFSMDLGDIRLKYSSTPHPFCTDGEVPRVFLFLTAIYGNPKGKLDRKSTRLNSSHVKISYAVFCLKKKKQQIK